MDQPGKVTNPARGQLNRENKYSPGRKCLRIWSRETGSAVPSRGSLFILYTQAESGAYLRDSSRFHKRDRGSDSDTSFSLKTEGRRYNPENETKNVGLTPVHSNPTSVHQLSKGLFESVEAPCSIARREHRPESQFALMKTHQVLCGRAESLSISR